MASNLKNTPLVTLWLATYENAGADIVRSRAQKITQWRQFLIPIRACRFVSKRLKTYQLANHRHPEVAMLDNGSSMSAQTGFERRFILNIKKFVSRGVIRHAGKILLPK